MLRTFETEEEIYKKFKEICIREGIEIGEKLNEFIKNYIKEHGEGNPAYSLDKFQDPDFKITPAFGESLDRNWRNFIAKSTKKEAEEISWKAEGIMKLARRRFYES